MADRKDPMEGLTPVQAVRAASELVAQTVAEGDGSSHAGLMSCLARPSTLTAASGCGFRARFTASTA